MSQEHAYVLAVEVIKYLNPTFQSSIYRVLFSEITSNIESFTGNSQSHHALDVWGGNDLLFFGIWRTRKANEFYERVSGARMHVQSYFV
jgi:NADH:ubiquinone oxidoreductase subunit D